MCRDAALTYNAHAAEFARSRIYDRNLPEPSARDYGREHGDGMVALPCKTNRALLQTSRPVSSQNGDFEICPLERDIPRHMRRVCVSGADNLVVKNLSGEQPPFRLLSTWLTAAAPNKKDP